MRWIPSKLNIADKGSRLAEGAKDSELLVDLLPDEFIDAVKGTPSPKRT